MNCGRLFVVSVRHLILSLRRDTEIKVSTKPHNKK
jgi:hypothetical protein